MEAHNFDPNTYQRDLTIVCALYDINRVGRPISDYLQWLNVTLKLNAPFVFFTQAKNKDKILSLVPKTTPILMIIVELEDLIYFKDFNTVNDIIKSEEYKQKMPDSNRLECVNPLYSIVIFSKFTFMEISTELNPFKSSKFLWVDAGASRFFGNFDLSTKILGTSISVDKFLVIMQRRFFPEDIFVKKDRNMWMSTSYTMSTILGGTSLSIKILSIEIYKEWLEMLKGRVVNNEQIALHTLYLRRPELFQLYIHPTTDFVFDDFFRYLA
jgi:hypothetical protein